MIIIDSLCTNIKRSTTNSEYKYNANPYIFEGVYIKKVRTFILFDESHPEKYELLLGTVTSFF